MANTATGRRLTEQHRLAQLALEVATIAQLRRIWGSLDPNRLEATTTGWLTAALAIIATQHQASTLIASRYFQAFRVAEVGAVFRGLLPEPEFNRRAAAASLIVSGPVRLRKATEATLPRFEQIAETEVARAGSRHAVNGGREVVRGASLADPRARGWARITSAKACRFCSLLAGRGAVYSEATVDFQAHDGCHCHAEPAY